MLFFFRRKIILVKALEKRFRKAGNIPETIIIHISQSVSASLKSSLLLEVKPKFARVETRLCRISERNGVTICISTHSENIQGVQRQDESRSGIAARNISWSPVDLRRCGGPDTPNSLSRSNLIGRPQRLYGRPCVETDNVCTPCTR